MDEAVGAAKKFTSITVTPAQEVQGKATHLDFLSKKSMGSAGRPITVARPSSCSTRRSILQTLFSASTPSSSTEQQQQQLTKGAGQAAPVCTKGVDQQLHYYNYWAITPFGINASSSFVYKPRVTNQPLERNPINVDQITPTRTISRTSTPALASRQTLCKNAITAHEAVETQALENPSPPLNVPPVSCIDSFVSRSGESAHTDDVSHAYHVNQKLQHIHRRMLESLRDQSDMPTSASAQKDLQDVAFLVHECEELQQVMDQSLPQQVIFLYADLLQEADMDAQLVWGRSPHELKQKRRHHILR